MIKILQLIEIAAHLTCLHLFCARVIEHDDPPGATDHPVEMVGIGAVLMLIGRQVEPFPEGVGDE